MFKKTLVVIAVSTLVIFSGFFIAEAAPTITSLIFSGGDTDITTASNQNFTIMPGAGYVGIGTTLPNYLLDVNGTINALNVLINGQPISATGGVWSTTTGGIYYNGGYVGIGTTIPTRALEIWSNGLQGLELRHATTTLPVSGGGSVFAITNTDTTATSASAIVWRSAQDDGLNTRHAAAIVFGKDANWVANSGVYPAYMAFYTRPNAAGSDAERVRINSSGYVGIGTTVPTGVLDVKGVTNATDTLLILERYVDANSTIRNIASSYLKNTKDGSFLYNGYRYNADNTRQATWSIYDGTSTWREFVKFIYETQTLYLGGAATSTILGTAGNVGIGTATPSSSYILDVYGSGHFTGISYGASPGESNPYALTTVEYVNGKSLPTGISGQTLRHNGSAWATSSFLFNTGSRIGVGTTAPNYVLDVNGAVNTNTGFYVNGVAMGTGGGSQWVSGSGGVIYYNGGNVGVMTTNPSATLQVNTPYSTASGNGIRINRPSSLYYSGLEYTTNGVMDWVQRVDSSGGLGIYEHGDVSSVRLLIQDGGNIGIGTTVPSNQLTILHEETGSIAPLQITSYYSSGVPQGQTLNIIARGTQASPTAIQINDVMGGFRARGYGATAFSSARVGINGYAAENWTDTAQGTYINFMTTSIGTTTLSEKVRIDDSGNVGVGTTAPGGDKLKVVGVGSFSGLVYGSTPGSTNTYALATVEYVNSSSGALPAGISSQTLRYNGTSWVANSNIFNNGTNVGIGTTVPNSRLQVSTLSSSNGALGQRWSYNSGDNNYYLDLKQTVSSGVVRWNFSQLNNSTAYNDVLVLDRGYVGIGTTNPTSRLQVGSYSGFADWDFAAGNSTGGLAMTSGASNNTIFGTNLIFIYAQNAGSPTVSISSTTVGIGTTAPSSKLRVAGSFSASGALTAESTVTLSSLGNISTSSVVMSDNSGNLFATTTSYFSTMIGGLPSAVASQTLRYDGGAWVANSNIFNTGTSVGIGTTVPKGVFTVAATSPNETPCQTASCDFEASDAATDYNVGYKFTVNTSGQITKLWFNAPNTNNYTVRLYDSSGTVLASGTRSGVLHTWVSYDVGPINVTAGNWYVVAVRGSSGGFRLKTMWDMPSTASITVDEFRYSAATNNMPTTADYSTARGMVDITYQSNSTYYPFNIDTNKNVGIGLTAPNYKLDVSGAINGTSVLVNGVPINGSQWTTSGSNIYYNSGNVSIGSAPSAYMLDISGSLRSNSLLVNSSVTLSALAGTGGTVMADVSGNLYLSSTSTSGNLPAGTTGQTLRHNGTDWIANSLVFNDGTNVGIGTASPAVKLHVYTGDGTSGLRTSLVCSGATTSKLLTDANGTIICGSDQAGSGTGNIIDSLSSTLGAGNDAGGLNILNVGNLGIGTSSPAVKLQVYTGNGTSGFRTSLVCSNSTTSKLYTDANGTLVCGTDQSGSGTGNIVDNLSATLGAGNDAGGTGIINLGNVGIGTASPATKLHLYDASSGPILTMSGLNSNYRGVTLKDTTGAEQWFYGSDSSNLFVVRQGGATNALAVNSSSNVGIGTTAPAVKLQVYTGDGTSGLRTSLVCSGSTSSKLLTDANGTIICGSDQAGSGTGNIIDTLSSTLAAGNDASGYNISNLGNVGIGTTAVSNRLQVSGVSYLDGNVFVGGGLSTYDTTVTDNYVEAGGYCMGNGTNCITSWPAAGLTGTGSTNYVAKFASASSLTYGIIYDTGTRVGINTASPGGSYTLDVNGVINAATSLCINGDCKTSWPTSSSYWTLSGSNLYTSSTSYLVGIGMTPTGSYKLEVNGEGWANAWRTGSDARFKTNVKKLTDVLSKIEKIDAVSYNWDRAKFPDRNFSADRQIGFIAQDVEKQFPEVVGTDAAGYKNLSYDRFSAILLEAIKEQQVEIDDLKAKIDSLEKALQGKQ